MANERSPRAAEDAPTRSERESSLAAGDSNSAFIDPRAYLQARTKAFARALFIIFSGICTLVFLTFIQAAGGVSEIRLAKLLTLPELPAVAAFAWFWSRRGERSVAALRAVEVAMTLVTSFFMASVPLFAPSTEAATAGVFHTAALTGCLLILRAAVVPSTTRLTLLVSTCAAAPFLVIGYMMGLMGHGWGLSNTPPAAGNAAIVALPLVGFVITAAIITHVVHGLETRARKALQLGQYTLEELIGEGGMGQVYKARHALLRRPTAIKLLPKERAGDTAVLRFEREVQQTSRLTHPNTVAIYDFGRSADGTFYYAMEYLEGISLEELVQVAGPLPASRVVHVLAQVTGALKEAHSLGLIHRDLKPANIMLCQRGGVDDTVKVLDFGLVKDIGAPKESALTATSAITGTPLYMAPEVLVDPDNVDARTDLYALGAVGYFLLCGEHVFDGRTVVEVCSHHLHSAPKPPSERLGAEVDATLEKALLQCLAKDKDDRPASAEALLEVLLTSAAAGGWSKSEAAAWWRDQVPKTGAPSKKTKHPAATMAIDPAERDGRSG